MSTPSINLPANLSFIGHVPKKQKRLYKKTNLTIAILDFDIENAIEFFKNAYLFLKPSQLLPNANKVAINFTEVSSKIMELDIYKEAFRNPIHR